MIFALILGCIMPLPTSPSSPKADHWVHRSSPGRPRISEFLASNTDGLLDEDQESSDWIEIYNPQPVPFDLTGYFLTDDPLRLDRWSFPHATWIAPGGFLVVFASDKNRRVPGNPLHTNFKLRAAGEYLALVDPDGQTIINEFTPQYPPQYSDASFGLSFQNGGPVTQGGITDNSSYFVIPTPSQPNGTGGPLVLDVTHFPVEPLENQALSVQAFVPEDLGAQGRIELLWRVMFRSEQSVLMVDNGTQGDAIAGDRIYTAQIPSFYFSDSEMIRYKIQAGDASSTTLLPPFSDQENSPQYFGTMVRDPRLSSSLPIWHWFVENPADADTNGGTRGSLFFDGTLYENIFVRTRGDSSLSWRKKNYKFDFNKGHHLTLTANIEVEEANLNSSWSDKSFLNQTLASRVYQELEVPASETYPVRVQQNGEFFSVAFYVEQPDDLFLERYELDPEGALYKMGNTLNHWTIGVEKKTRLHEDNEDLREFVRAIRPTEPLDERRLYVMDNVDLPAVISYLAATCLIHDNDHVGKNYYVYRDSEGDGEWRFIPWDKDLTMGRNFTLTGGVLNDSLWADRDPQSHPLYGDRDHKKIDGIWNRLIHNIYEIDETRDMYLARLRTVMGEVLEPPHLAPSQRWFEREIVNWLSVMQDDVALDEARWGIPTWGSRLGFVESVIRIFDEFLHVRRQHLFVTHSAVNGGIIPESPRLHQGLRIASIEGDPSSGDQGDEYVELFNPNPFALDISGWSLEGGIDFRMHPGTVIPAGSSAFVSPDLVKFRTRENGPSGGQGLFVIGPYQRNISDGELIRLRDHRGAIIDEVIYREP